PLSAIARVSDFIYTSNHFCLSPPKQRIRSRRPYWHCWSLPVYALFRKISRHSPKLLSCTRLKVNSHGSSLWKPPRGIKATVAGYSIRESLLTMGDHKKQEVKWCTGSSSRWFLSYPLC